MSQRLYFRANAKQAKKLCDQGRYLADYLNITADPYDFHFLLQEWANDYFSIDPDDPDSVAPEDVEDLSPSDLKAFTKYVEKVGVPYAAAEMGTDAPAYTHFERAEQLPAGTWLVHFSRAQFSEFLYGTTLEGLHLSTWKKKKEKADCRINLSDDIGPFEIVWGFAVEADATQSLFYSMWRAYGEHVLLFKTDCAVKAYHLGDRHWQVMFPLCSEYDVHPGTFTGTKFYFEGMDEEEVGPFATPAKAIELIERAA